jgi:poly(3-hydroxybutyrate) depolymerase
MGKVFKLGKTIKFSNSCVLWVVVFILIGDFNSLFTPYSSRQVARQVPHGYKTKFWLYTPENYTESREPYPVLVSLHGGSAIGDNLNMLFERTHENPPQLIHINQWFDLPFIVVSPQLRRDPAIPHYNEQTWPPDLVDEVIEYVLQKYNADASRVYITGISLGSAGAWNYAAAYPEKVAALLPLGGQSPSAKACALKDVPIWAFHGENDVFVRTRFTTDMVNAISECQPAGKYIPHANICKSMEHEVWDQVFNMKGGYDVYSWLLSFRKGDTSNVAPFVTAGVKRKLKITEDPVYITADYFDSDGTIDKILWTQVDTQAPRLTLQDTTSRFLRINGVKNPGEYTFRITATDNDGATKSDEVTLLFEEELDSPAILSLSLTNQTGTRTYATLANDQLYDLRVIGNRLNIHAETNAFNVRMRWSVNSDQRTREVGQFHLRFWKDYSPFFLRATQEGPVKSGWTVSPGEYLICATAFRNGSMGADQEGTSLCYRIIFTDSGLTDKVRPGLFVNNLSLSQPVGSSL